jgi:hypothetical protein
MGRDNHAGQESDQEHAAAAAGTGVERVAASGVGGLGVVDCGHRRLGWRNGEQLTAAGKLGSAISISEVAVVTDAVETVRQDMEEEAADEVVGGEGHHLGFAGIAVVCPAKADAAVLEREQPAVGDGDTVGVAGEVGQHLLGAGERGLA